MDYVRVAGLGDVAPGQIRPIEAGGHKLLLANVDGRYHAAQRKCPHLGFNLCRGTLDGHAVVCPLHKAKFDLDTGRDRSRSQAAFHQHESEVRSCDLSGESGGRGYIGWRLRVGGN